MIFFLKIVSLNSEDLNNQNMPNQIFKNINYQTYKNQAFESFTFSNTLVQQEIEDQYAHLNWQVLGLSFEERPIKMLQIGTGKTRVLLWSQMHGDEPTATAAMFDILNFLDSKEELAQQIKTHLSIYFIAVINPDGQEMHTRRNAQQIDINRDYLALQSPEANLLKNAFHNIKPDFAFNLHSQGVLYRTTNQDEVAIALLAPAADKNLSQTWEREQAMKVIAEINHMLQNLVPQKVARFKDEYEPRAFGDNFQKHCPTILIEAGYLTSDEHREYIRELNFYTLLTAFESIASQSYQEVDLLNYLMIPLQSPSGFDIKIEKLQPDKNKPYTIDLGFTAQKTFNQEFRTFETIYNLTDIGDLQFQSAFTTIQAKDLVFIGELAIDKTADITLIDAHGHTVLEIKMGVIV
jgi:hypothetical protein